MTLTKEWLLKTISELEEERDATPGSVNEDAAMALEAMKLALASMTAEPVCYLNRFTGRTFTLEQQPGADKDMDVYVPLYTAPPAPVVPDELLSDMEEVLRISDRDHDAWHKVKAGIVSCRAAMLQGAAGNSPAIPDGWVACSERMPTIGVPVITCCGDVVQYAVYAWDGKEWQDWYEEYDKLPSDTFTHWHPRPAAPQQEAA